MISLKDDGLWWPDNDVGCKPWTEAESWIPGYIADVCDQLNIKKSNIIHAGGNVGKYALSYAEYFDAVYVAEPESINYACLEKNCAPIDNIKYFNVAFGDVNSTCSIKTADISNCGLYKINNMDGAINMVTIDQLNISDVSVIHLDIEGFELPALKGAVETIKINKPLIAVEANDKSDEYGYGIQQIREFLHSLGYNIERSYASEVMFYYET